MPAEPKNSVADLIALLNSLALPSVGNMQATQGGGNGQFSLANLFAAANQQGYPGQPIPELVGAGGGMLPGAYGQTFGPNVPFWGGSVFKPDERAAIFQNAGTLATNLMKALADMRRKRDAERAAYWAQDAAETAKKKSAEARPSARMLRQAGK